MTNTARVRYAVVGLGHIAQVAVLPAFTHAVENSELVALVSDDPIKRQELGDRYSIKNLYSYNEYGRLLESGLIDAVYIALPNSMHCEYAVRAAEAGKHVLCEKPMAVTEDECKRMLAACEASDVRLMIAYRLHFEESNLKAIEVVQSGAIGEPRIFQSTFCEQVKEVGIRLRRELGGGSVYDIGIYCINAARYLFQDEPFKVIAACIAGTDPRFEDVDEMTSVILHFPKDRLATFTCSFGAADVSAYRVIGINGDLRVEPAYEYVEELTHYLTVKGKTSQQTFAVGDQFAPELIYFSQCIQEGKEPEPSGYEGLADVRIIEAVYRSAADGVAVPLEPLHKRYRPSLAQAIREPPVEKPKLVHTTSPTQ